MSKLSALIYNLSKGFAVVLLITVASTAFGSQAGGPPGSGSAVKVVVACSEAGGPPGGCPGGC